MRARARDATAAAVLVALKAGAMAYALHCGFAQISDDDYARTVIAQTFAHAPRLDPSGTSWLPFPFWLYGSVMMMFGRSLAVARAFAFLLGCASPVVIYAGLRSMGIAQLGAWLGTAIGALTPWSVWLGLAPVPEGWAGAFAAAALLVLASRRHPLIAGLLVLVSALSRYEAWPVAGVVAATCVVRAVRGPSPHRARCAAGAALAIAGPALWLANNALVHGDALHFVTRVTAFHRSHAEAATVGNRVLEYPRALAREAPEILVAGAVGATAAFRRPELRRAWSLPLAGAGAVLAFLIYGALRDGAPTHHPARALIPVMIVLAGFGGVGLAFVAGVVGRVSAFALTTGWLAFVALRCRDVPGATEVERREVQIARGHALVSTEGMLDITPCAYEHYALVASLGAPERVTVGHPTGAPVTPDCPRVTPR